MWNSLDIPVAEKRKFLAEPGQHSMHNYGAAVDLSIVDQYGDPLDMGTPYDHRGPKAYPRKEEELLEEGKLTEQQVKNRRLLRDVMTKAGFNSIPTEWWHFSIKSMRAMKRHYELVE
jgi:D-alanyl-D-alanine dipeptidase